ncbi:class I SAM-dependent methyltransferase [Patescibacteria group bacterium]|nr:class I SAM-dependent methyltransferase [Patescibacteria group bacterium]
MKILPGLYKIKEDLKGLFRYPVVDLAVNPCVSYDKYWETRGRNASPVLSDWQKKRADIVLKAIEKNSSVLDLGCGNGAFIKYLEVKAGIKGVGVDLNDKILEQAKSIGVATIKMDITDLNSIKSLPEFDYITGFEIIEHLSCPEGLLDCLRGKARKAMFFSIPNTGYYAHRLRLLLGKFLLQWASHPGEHLRFWTVSDVKWWLKSLGFNIESLELYEGIPLLNKIWPSLFAQGMVFKITAKK